jgi:hypothetical protein
MPRRNANALLPCHNSAIITLLSGLWAIASAQQLFYVPQLYIHHRHSYPVVIMNVCSLKAEDPLGDDGSLLVRRYWDMQHPLNRFCRFHKILDSTCGAVADFVAKEIERFPQQYNWIVSFANATVLVRFFLSFSRLRLRCKPVLVNSCRWKRRFRSICFTNEGTGH